MADPTNLTDSQFLSQDPEVLGLQRQRQLANLLTGQAFNAPQGQMISGHYVKPSALQQALPMINAAIGGMTNANLDTKQTELAAALRGKEQQAVQQYMAAKTPQEQFMAGTSQYAPAQLKSSAYEMLKPQVLAPDATIVKPSFGAEGGYQTMASGNTALPAELKSAAIRLGLDPKQAATWGSRELSAIDQMVKSDRKSGASNLTVHTGNALGGALGEGIGKEDVALRSAAKNAELTVQNADQALKNLDKAITGPNADIRLQAAKYLNIAGADNESTIKASELAFAQRGQAILGRVKSSGLAGSQGLTEGERKFLTKAYGGDLNLDKETLKGMLMLEKRIAKRDAQMWNQRITEYSPEIVKGAGLKSVNVPDLGEVDINNSLLK